MIEKIQELESEINEKLKSNNVVVRILGNEDKNIEYLYEFVGGKLNNRILTREEINEISNELTKDYSEERKKGIAVHRKELDNQPTVEGYLGPMYNGIDYGKIILRYETQEVYDMLSD